MALLPWHFLGQVRRPALLHGGARFALSMLSVETGAGVRAASSPALGFQSPPGPVRRAAGPSPGKKASMAG